MATAQQSPIDSRLLPLGGPEIVRSQPNPERGDKTEDSGQESRPKRDFAAILREIAQWEAAKQPKSGDTLDEDWKSISKGVSSTAEEFRKIIATGKVLQGDARIFSDHLTLIGAALRESRSGIEASSQLPYVQVPGIDSPVPRGLALANVYLQAADYSFQEGDFAAFLADIEETTAIRMAEVWSLKPFLELALLLRVSEAISKPIDSVTCDFVVAAKALPNTDSAPLRILVESLESLSGLEWKEFFEQASATERVLRRDPSGAYPKMDFESRESYRTAVADLAKYSDYSEKHVAEAAIDLALRAERASRRGEKVSERSKHVGYYLTSAGQAALKEAIDYRPPLGRRTKEILLKWSDFFYLIGIELAMLAVVAFLISFSHLRPLPLVAIAFLILPAVECAVATMNLLATRLFPPKRLPRLDFSKGIPDDCVSLVAVPILLTSEVQVRSAVHALEIRFLANRDKNLHFALLTDMPDSNQQFDDKDALAGFCSTLIDQLNRRYSQQNRGSFFHFHRHRAYNAAEGLWMGWERKRGKLLDLNRFLLHQSDQFPVKTGDLSLLSNIRYVITLDADTQLPADVARRLVATLAHPLNRAVVDPVTNTVVEGYAILQPRVDISIRSASRSRFAALLSGDTGVDFYTRAVSDVYQDLFGEGIFTGKGIYDVEAFHRVLEHRFPCNAILSHDLIEGVYARTGLVSDLEVVDDYPSHFSAYSRRKHRWVRGDWQIIFSLPPRMRDFFGKMVRNPLSHISRWKIIDNLRRSLMDCALFLVFLGGWLWLPGNPLYWTLGALALMAFPVYFQFVVGVLTAGSELLERHFWKNLGADFVSEQSSLFFRLAFLFHQTLVSADAVIRTLIRMKFTHKRLLQWETAADAEVGTGESLVDVYLRWTPLISAAIGVLIFVVRPKSLECALPVLLLWASSNWICKWLNKAPRTGESRIDPSERAFVRNVALRTWRFFREHSTQEENWLVPDIVQETPPQIAHRVSTTNLGLLLNARLAALDLGFLTLPEFIKDTSRTLETVSRMAKFNGQLYNWYATDTLEAVEPRFVSTVDNGNLVCSYWTLKHGCLEAIKQPLFRPILWRGIQDFADLLVELASSSQDSGVVSAAKDLRERVRELSGPEMNRFRALPALEIDIAIFLEKLSKRDVSSEIAWWAHELSLRIASLKDLLEAFAPWLLEQSGAESLREAPDWNFIENLTLESLPHAYGALLSKLAKPKGDETPHEPNRLSEALEQSIRSAQVITDQLNSLADSIQRMVDEMEFAFLYDPQRKLLSIGYDGNEGSVSKYHYDLLASEARAAAFVAIAKGDIPHESWFELGRSYVDYAGETVLRSWTGTAFEYLMPCLWIRTYPNTVLEDGARGAIRANRKFVAGREIPWGISESACNQRNPDGHYRYHAFGVPGLAINRDDCSGDLVIAPYATFLALPFEATTAVKNLKKMKELGWLSAYGFYEAGDFTPRRIPDGKSHEIVRNWMAHHQGMTLVAIANALCDSVMLRRFHAEPCVAAHERLLHEKEPRVPPMEKTAEVPDSKPKRLLALMQQTMQPSGVADLALKPQ